VPAPTFGARTFPFDHFEVASIDVDLAKMVGAPAGVAKVTGLRLDVQRGPGGRFTGLVGGADLVVPTAALGAGAPAFFREVGGDKLGQSLHATLAARAARATDQPTEQSTLTLNAPGVLTLSLSLTTRQLSEALAAVLTQQVVPPDYVTVSSITLDVADDGLLAYMLSDRYAAAPDLKGTLEGVSEMVSAADDTQRARDGLVDFITAPKGLTWTATSDRFLRLEDFMRQAVRTRDERRATSVASRVTFVGRGPGHAVVTTAADPASLTADGAAYKADCLKMGRGRRFLAGSGLLKFRSWKLAADAGNPTAALLVGACYERGSGVDADRAAALRWYHRAAEKGDAVAMRHVGEVHEHERGGFDVPTDYAQALRWYTRAAAAGDAQAMYRIGKVHEKNLASDQSVGWYLKAAEAGNVDGMTELAHRYENGWGARLDGPEAVRWYGRAADAGSAEAMTALAKLYEEGRRGVPKDGGRAAEWRRRAAAARTAPFPFK
jgi:TPR repeat protein